MGKFGHTLRRWRSAILKNKEATVLPSPLPANDPVEPPWNPYLEPLLDLSTTTINRTWMDLPQEIVDHVMLMLRHDLKSLKACSLTCKALFVSARPFIHKKICLTSALNWKTLTLQEQQRYIRGEREGLAVKTLSGAAAHGLLRFGRHLFIRVNQNFTPTNLQPFNDHFQRFDRIQALSIHFLHTQSFLEQFDTFFANFVPTLRSLCLHLPSGNCQDILDFVCRFPRLDDLALKMPSEPFGPLGTWEPASTSITKKIPPFRGRLKFDGTYVGHTHMLRHLISLPGKRRFRFIDFRGCSDELEQSIIDALSGTIETLSLTWRNSRKGLPLDLVDVRNLHSLTLRTSLVDLTEVYGSLSQTLHTVISPLFSEFILELEQMWWTQESRRWGTWAELDKMFEAIDKERGFRVIIRAERVGKREGFFANARDQFPLMNARNRLKIEIRPFREK